MREHRLINADFFHETHPGFRTVEDAGSYDLVIGNAPWGEELLTDAAKKWAKHSAHPWPLPNKGIGTLFLPKAAALTKQGGHVSMIQSASSLLFNRSGTAREFRRKFFASCCVEEVINLSALRFELFRRKARADKASIAPSCVIILRAKSDPLEAIRYVTAKQAENSVDEFGLAIHPADVRTVLPSDAAHNEQIWAALMWGDHRDVSFLRVLESKLTLKELKRDGRVVIREGIIPSSKGKLHPDTKMRRFWDGDAFPPSTFFLLDTSQIQTTAGLKTHRKTSLRAFDLPQLTIKQGWQLAPQRFAAAVTPMETGEGVLFNQSYLSVHQVNGESDILEAAWLSYNSILAVYFLLLTSGRFASYRPEPLVEELLRVPIPEPCQNRLTDVRSVEEIDRRVREAFDLKDAEWVLVEDLFNVTLPDFKRDASSPGRQPTLRRQDSDTEPQLRRYCEYFIRVLKAGFGPDKKISATIFQETDGPLPYRLVAFELGRASRIGIRVERLAEPALLAELEKVNQTWLRNCRTARGSVYHHRVAKVYDHSGDNPTIFLIKPDAYRYWTRSMGLHDADEVAADFVRWQTAMEKVRS
jgi:hypothetical protein